MVRDYFGTITSNLQCVTANNSEEQSKSHRNAHGRYWPAPVVDPLLQSSAHLKERTALRLTQVTEPWKLVLIQSQPLKIHTKTQHESKSERRTKVMLKAAVGPGPKETFPSVGAEHKLRFFPQCTRFLWAAHPSRSVTVEAHILRKSQWFWLETGHEDLCCSLKHVTQCGHFGETSSSSCFLTRWNSRTLRQNCSSVQLWTDSSSLKQAEGSPVGFCLVRLTQMGPVIWFVLVENCSQELLQVDQHRGGVMSLTCYGPGLLLDVRVAAVHPRLDPNCEWTKGFRWDSEPHKHFRWGWWNRFILLCLGLITGCVLCLFERFKSTSLDFFQAIVSSSKC